MQTAITETDRPADLHEFAFYIINKENPLPEDLTVETALVQGNFELDIRCRDYAVQMLEDARRDGVELTICSAYRSAQEQETLFKDYAKKLIRKRYTEKEALALTEMQIAYPNESEHNAGLALDIVSADWFLRYDELVEDFEYTSEFKWLSANSWKYGFILRYPKGKTDITGMIYEPWHYRFVGLQKAEQLYCSGLTLEEYIDKYVD